MREEGRLTRTNLKALAKFQYKNYLRSKKWRAKKSKLVNLTGGKFYAVYLTKKNIDTYASPTGASAARTSTIPFFLCREHHFAYYQTAKDIKAKGCDDTIRMLNTLKATAFQAIGKIPQLKG